MEEDHPRLTLVLVNYRSGEPLRRFFASLRSHPIHASHEVVVVDNSAGDGTAAWLADAEPRVRVLDAGGNVGYARAVNAAIEVARGEHLLVVNPDVELAAGAVDRALDYLLDHPEVGLVGAQLLDPDGSIQRNARRFYSLTSILLRRTPLGRRRPDHPELRRHLMLDDDLSVAGPVDWVTGAFMLVRREALQAVGPMDRRFFLYFEDVDWCYRMWEEGWEVHLLPEVRLVHQYQRTSQRLSRSLLHHARSFLSFYDKWGALVYAARRMHRVWERVAAVASDLVALNLAFLAAFYLRKALDPYFPQPLFDLVDYLPLIVAVNLVSLVVLPLTGRYRDADEEEETGGVARVLSTLQATFFVTLVVMAGAYLTHTRTFSRAVLLLFVPSLFVALEWTRWIRERVLGGGGRRARRVRRALAVGADGDELARLAGVLAGAAATDGRIVGGWSPQDGRPRGLRAVGGGWPLSTVVDRYRVTDLLLDAATAADSGLRAEVDRVRWGEVRVWIRQAWAPATPGRGDRVHRWGTVWWRWPAPAALRGAVAVRGVLDRTVGLALVLVSLPGFVLCSTFGRVAGVRLDTVERIGRHRRSFRLRRLVDRTGRVLPGWVQTPTHLLLLSGRLGLSGPRALAPGREEDVTPDALLRFEVAPGLCGPWIDSGQDESTLVRREIEELEAWTPSRHLHWFLRGLTRLLARGEPWPEDGAFR